MNIAATSQPKGVQAPAQALPPNGTPSTSPLGSAATELVASMLGYLPAREQIRAGGVCRRFQREDVGQWMQEPARRTLAERAPDLERARNASCPDIDPRMLLLSDLPKHSPAAAGRRRLWAACMKNPSEAFEQLADEAKHRFENAFLTNATRLDWSRCDIQGLPPEIRLLPQLQSLSLNHSLNLVELGPEIGNLTTLESLSLVGCDRLLRLPPEIARLCGLKQLKLAECDLLEELPADLGQLSSLQGLFLSECNELQRLPPEIGALHALQSLDLECCADLKTLPMSLLKATQLKRLNVSGLRLDRASREIVEELRIRGVVIVS